MSDSENESEGKQPEGWTWVIGATKEHYMVGTMSICGRWWLPGSRGTGYSGTQPRNACVLCQQKLTARERKGGTV